jgi:hypothetical protein
MLPRLLNNIKGKDFQNMIIVEEYGSVGCSAVYGWECDASEQYIVSIPRVE